MKNNILYFYEAIPEPLNLTIRMIENPNTPDLETTQETDYIAQVKKDLWMCFLSREVSLMGRKEVLTGKAKFGILGDGKEVAQVAMAKFFEPGDWRSGYYRDQTWMMAAGISKVEDFFAQLYADANHDPFSGGRQMNSHYATSNFNPQTGEWIDQTAIKNSSADVSCTGGQMGRALGLATASKKFRELPDISGIDKFSKEGREICFCTIGDASTSEGAFWETMNAAVVTKVPLLVAVWDDGYGISVPKKYQTTKSSISKAMEGFLLDEEGRGMHIYTVKAWDYPGLVATFEKAVSKMRDDHIPALVHVQDCTQPQGHSTSGSHERYKSKERLAWERDYDCNEKMAEWMLESKLITEEELQHLRSDAKRVAKEAKKKAWLTYIQLVNEKLEELRRIYTTIAKDEKIDQLNKEIKNTINPFCSEIIQNARKLRIYLHSQGNQIPEELDQFINNAFEMAESRYHSHLYSESELSALNIEIIPPEYSEDSPLINGYQVINKFFDIKFAENDKLLAFGEDVGQIGDVNQGFAGLQKKYGKERIFDTGIREWTIVGNAIGLGMRGFRPIAEIQYLDYLIYGLAPLSDDLATVRYRSNGIQRSTAIIRTRGHRLEGIWHAGSPMGMLINTLRGMIVAVPRNMVQAAGIYNTLIKSDEAGIVVECLNGYRLKEKLPDNLGEYTVPVGMPEILNKGNDITIVTYGSCVREAGTAVKLLDAVGISVELIDVQTLLPFDTEHIICQSIKKTNKVVFLDEDVPGGGTGYMMKKVLEDQQAFQYLDASPITITSHDHRPPYGSDGDYFSKPNAEDIFERIYLLMKNYHPARFQ